MYSLNVDQSTVSLPGKVAHGGYVYVVAFDNGTTKVGSTANPRARIAGHEGHARAFGIRRTRVWVSPLHDGFVDTEKRLISIAKGLSTGVERAEYFTGVDMNALLASARRISFPPVDMAAHEAREARAREKAAAFFGRTPGDPSQPEILTEGYSEAVGRLFGRRPDGSYSHGQDSFTAADVDLEMDLIHQIADVAEVSIDEILAMDAIDMLAMTLTYTVRAEANRLRLWAIENGRTNLRRPYGEYVTHGSLKPTTDIEPSTSPRS